jgi:hypothetical protein
MRSRRENRKRQLFLELSILFPAYSLMKSRVAAQPNLSETEDEALAKAIIDKLYRSLASYAHMSKEAMKIANSVMLRHPEETFNSFVVGLTMLGCHNEINNKIISTCIDEEFNRFYDLMTLYGKQHIIDKSRSFSEKVFIDLQKIIYNKRGLNAKQK